MLSARLVALKDAIADGTSSRFLKLAVKQLLLKARRRKEIWDRAVRLAATALDCRTSIEAPLAVRCSARFWHPTAAREIADWKSL